MEAAELERLTVLQKQTGDELDRLLVNYKKDSEVRKTEAYLQNRIIKINNLWKEFTSRHIIIEASGETDHAYFTTEYYQKVEAVYKQALKIFEAKLETVKNSPITQHSKANENEIQRLIKKQATQKSALLRLIQKINSESAIQHSKGYYTQNLKIIAEYWSTYIDLTNDVLALNTNEIFHESEELVDMENIYQETVIRLQENLDEGENKSNKYDTIQDVTLPCVKIPVFNGDLPEWKSFHDLFREVIHNNGKIKDVQKMQYLKTHVTGEAEKIIRHLGITKENYASAWELLVNRYDNKRLLVATHIQSLLTIQQQNNESPQGIKKIYDLSKENIHALQNLGVDTSSWGPIIIQILIKKLDKESHRLFEHSLKSPKEVPSLEEFYAFLETRFQALEAVGEEKLKKPTFQLNKYPKMSTPYKNIHTRINSQCSLCKLTHKIYQCGKFQEMSTGQRQDLCKKEKICLNCLMKNHQTQDCRNPQRCKVCQGKHNTLLHHQPSKNISKSGNDKTIPCTLSSTASRSVTEDIQSHFASKNAANYKALLATAQIKILAPNGNSIIVRALLDQGSEASFITEDLVQRLNLKRIKVNINIEGIGASAAGVSRSLVNVSFQAKSSPLYTCSTDAFVLKRLTKFIPSEPIPLKNWKHIQHLVLADENFDKPGPIEMILGVDVYSKILLNTVIKGPPNTPIAQKSKLGWILSGPYISDNINQKISCMIATVNNEDDTLKKFWEIENIQTTRNLSKEEETCQKIYENTYRRKSDGRFIIKIPFSEKINELGCSRNMAMARFLQLERKFKKDENLKREYRKFMNEYIYLNHMTPVPPPADKSKVYYLPHHAVIKETSTTTKVRVVFDGSAESHNGISLNETMLNGPVLQEDITSILLRWRKHKIAYTADIEKMYRQIEIQQIDRDYHRIFWRSEPNQRIQEYQLNTITYGTKSAPYLAIKTLHQLAEIEQDRYPTAAKVLVKDFYVDDLISGNDTIEEAVLTQQELINALRGAGFHLRKWSSNNEIILKNLPKDSVEHDQHEIVFDDSIKTLGIYWRPKEDIFEFKINLAQELKHPTKRSLLSTSAKLFDPLGWLAPIIVKAKIMFQQLWIMGLSWDSELPNDIANKWLTFRGELQCIEKFKIPRWINHTKKNKIFELHGFCDASEAAYGAVVYSRVITESGIVITTLLMAKTKVAPIKNKISLPRLELCGALLLANLLKHVQEALREDNLKTYAWTDSTIVLAWLKGEPSRWNTFIANRINQIHEILHPSSWSHVKTEDNPADCASRGLNPSQLRHHKLWWNGPAWLSEEELIIKKDEIQETKLEKKCITLHSSHSPRFEVVHELLNKFSNYYKIQRILAYCKRFIDNTSKMRTKKQGYIKIAELREAKLILLRATQDQAFSEEIKQLSKKKELHKKSTILSLYPFLDNKNILRVGGRMENAHESYDRKHPMILPYDSVLTSRVLDEAHKMTKHGKDGTIRTYVQYKYWIINATRAIKKHNNRCIICHRYKAETRTQLMGNLPAPRVTVERPFTNTGVDYAGPIDIRCSKGRGMKSYKGYISVFVCLATKAIHLEVVSDLTSQAFILALKRFIARRGNVTNLYSDNGTNFIKANKILKEDYKKHFEKFSEEILPLLNKREIQWHFIPPSSPHFGGLWEAGVKSIKHHLRRTIGESKLTFEELTTVLAQIEACLNSRPLCPVSQDINNLDYLTPGHFLIGSSLLAPPEQDRLSNNITTLTRWQLLERKHQEFWRKWRNEYLSRLQQRPKWARKVENIRVGELVLLKEDNLPPSQWALARILQTHPGKDGLVRVVTIKTAKNTLKRPITKISPLPITDNEEIMEQGKNEAAKNNENKQQTENKTDKILKNVSANHIRLNETREPNPNENKSKLLIQPKIGKDSPKGLPSPTASKGKVFPLEIVEEFKRIRDKPIKGKRKIHPTIIPVRPPLDKLMQENKKRKIEISKGSLITTLLLTLIILPIAKAQYTEPLTITPFTNHPGIYFEDLGQAELSNNEWTIITYYNMDVYWQEINLFRNIIRSINDTCSVTIKKDKILCLRIRDQFQMRLKDIEFKNDLIHSMNEVNTNDNRQKRGAIDIVGNAFNSLFGVLDSRFAEMHEAQIKELKSNENHLLALIKNQTSIAETTKNIIKKDRLEIKQQLKTLQYYMESLRNSTGETSSELLDHRQRLRLLNLEVYLTLLMEHYVKTQDALLNVIIDTHNGKIDLHLLTPEQLQKELSLIRNHLPSSLRIPADSSSTEETLQIYKLLRARTRVTEENIIFDIRIPLVAKEQYQLFKAIPVPSPHGSEYIFIEPSTDYLITSLDREQYYPVKAGEIQRCVQLSEVRILCRQHRPLYNLLSRQNECEMSLFRHERTLPKNCRLKSMTPTQVWIQLHNPNTWIYVLDQEYTFNVICGQNVISKSLEGDGILTIQTGCAIKHKTMTISSHNEFSNRLKSSFSPNINISDQFKSEKYKSTKLKGKMEIFISNSSSEDIRSLEESINNLKENSALTREITNHDVQQYGFIGVLFIMLLVAIIVFWKKRATSVDLPQSVQQPSIHLSTISIPHPAPRRLQPGDFELQSTTVAENVQ